MKPQHPRWGEKTMRILLADSIEAVINAARRSVLTQAEQDACDFLEDFVVNELGDDDSFDPNKIDEAQDR